MPAVEELVEIKRRVENRLLKQSGVTGLDVGYKYVGGERTEDLAIRVHVREKTDAISHEERVPGLIDGATTDVMQGTFATLIDFGPLVIPIPNINQYRPVTGGVSTGPAKSVGSRHFCGTTAMILWDNVSSKPAMLTCFHVACLNDGWHVGDAQLQQAIPDFGNFDGDEIGWVVRATRSDVVDGAVVPLVGVDGTIAEILDIGLVGAPVPARLGVGVTKQGRTTGMTYGFVDGVDMTLTVQADPHSGLTAHMFHHQINIRPDGRNPLVIRPGDSGSAFVDDNNSLVGMAMSADTTGGSVQANPFGTILQELDLSLAPLSMRATIEPASLPIGLPTQFTIRVVDAATGAPLPDVEVDLHNYSPPKGGWLGGDLVLTHLPASNSPITSQATFHMGRTVIDPKHHIVAYDRPPFMVITAHGYAPVGIHPIFLDDGP